MSDFDTIIQINPIQPSTGPLSRQSGAGMPMQALAGLSDPRMIAMIVSEQLQALQDQIDTQARILRAAPTINYLNFPFLLVVGLQLTNNSLSAGNIAWSACTVWFEGNPYAISAGNTSAGAKLVWWTVGASGFSSGNSFTPNTTTYPIATNSSGTADTTWDKLGANSIQQANVLGGLLVGYQIQTPAQTSVSAGGTTTILSYTGAGALLTCNFPNGGVGDGVHLKTTGGAVLKITIDAQPSISINLLDNNAFASDGMDTQFLGMAMSPNASAAQTATVGFYVSFTVSLLIEIVVTGYTSGNSQMTVGWAKKI